MPNAMPITPKDLARFLGFGNIGDIGLARARGFPAVSPSMIRDTNTSHREPANARIQEPRQRPHLTNDKERLAPHVVRHAAENGGRDELAEGVGRNQQVPPPWPMRPRCSA